MTKDNTAFILTRLESGFRADAATLQELENDLAATMTMARDAGNKRAPSETWSAAWQRNWAEVMGSVRCISDHLVRIGDLVAGRDADRIGSALAIWESLQMEDAKLLAGLRGIRLQASELEATSRKEWNHLARVIESHLESIHTSAQALRVRLEFLKKHSVEDVEHFVANMRSSLLGQQAGTQMSAEPFDRDYRNAVLELEKEQHVFKGFLDVVKALSLWVESPDERMRKNRSLTLDDV